VRISRLFPAGMILAAGLYLAGCGPAADNAASNTAGTNNAGAAPSGKTIKVALLIPGDVNDQGWNQLAYEGLEAVKKELGAETKHQVTKKRPDHAPALRDLADQGYDLIICHGYEFGDSVKAIAAKYPNTKFAVIAGNVKQEPNVATVVPKLEDATYLLGMAAGGMTRTGVTGLIGGMEIPVIKSTFDAFTLGAQAANPLFKQDVGSHVLMSYVGNFEDQNAGKEQAKAMLAKKADFILHNADQAGKGMFDAAAEAKDVYVFGSNRNQNDVAPNQCLASAVIDMPNAFVELARYVRDGKFKAEFREMNLKNGNISVEWNPALKGKVPPALMKKIDQAAADIKSGKLKIERKV
jgi:basic membrane lipoprotein Med (substrate-binding protein (PBP1-ABC) superfamily)